MKEKFYDSLREVSHLDGISALLDWDQQVYMPKGGGDNRSAQLELIALLRHERITDPKLKEASQELLQDSSATEDDRVNAKGILRVIDRETKLPASFVAEKSRASSEAFQCWLDAKPKKNFKLVESQLKKIIELSKLEISLVGYEEHPYDALLDQYEWGGRVSWVYPALQHLSNELIPIVQSLSEKTKSWNEDGFSMPIGEQHLLNEKIMHAMGMQEASSRLDKSAHPFCTTIGANDYRITTRFDEKNFLAALLSTLHETGHSLYEAGLPLKWRGTPCGAAVSLGVHESQSRFYENMIGRSKEFSRYLSNTINNKTDSNTFWQALNKVSPSLIRVEADEVSYSLHVLLRLELEMELISGNLNVSDLPCAWNEKYKRYLGITPSHDGEGVLQDVHWYSGAIGYFSTYVLGNIYSGMFLERILKEMPDMYEQIEEGDFTRISSWLLKHVHSQGQRYEPRELIEKISNNKISAEPFVKYIKSKFNI